VLVLFTAEMRECVGARRGYQYMEGNASARVYCMSECEEKR